jgi:ABC-2 type transport system permease protein
MMLADRLFFTAMIIIPVLITVSAGYALRYEKLNTIPVAVVDEDQSSSSVLLADRLKGREGITLFIVGGEEAEKMLENNEVEQVFVIRQGFGESLKRGESDGLIEMHSSPSSYSAGFTREVVAGEAIRLVMNSMAANDVTSKYDELGIDMGSGFREEVEAFADAFWEPEPLMTIDYRELKGTAPEPVDRVSMPAATASSAGLIAAFIMFFMLFGSGWLVEERTNGTIKRLGAGHGAVAVSFGGSILALLAAGILQILMFGAILKLLFDIVLFTGILSCITLLSYLLAVTAVSMFLSSVLKTQAQLQAGAPVIALLTGFMGGCFWNFIEMPERIRFLSLLTPQGWALNALNGLLTDPGDVSVMLRPALVLLALSLILLPASYVIIKVQLKRG